MAETGVVLEEFGVGYGVADLIAARLDPRGIAERNRVGSIEGPLNRAAIQVLLAVQRSPKTARQLSEMTGIPPKRLWTDAIPALARRGFVKNSPTGLVRSPYPPIIIETWAVEAKLKNWFEGACQARRYQHFAHRSYIAIPLKKGEGVKRDVLRTFNLGLITVSDDTARIVMHPRRASPRSGDLFLLNGERIWSAPLSALAQSHTSEPEGRTAPIVDRAVG